MDQALCLYCHAALSHAETSDGWCASCGKRLPPLVLRAALAAETLAQRQTRERQQRAMAGWVMTGMILGLAGVVGSRLLFNLPHVHEPESSIAPWLFGAPALGGVFSGVLYCVLRQRHARLVSAGGCLLALAQLLIALTVVGLWFLAHLNG